jgi:predicted ATP-grasp superfamily ATP-dependent carboligase
VRIFIFEYTTGGGLFEALDAPNREPTAARSPGDEKTPHDFKGQTGGNLTALACEGQAMVSALAGDFALLAGAEVQTLRDGRWSRREPPGVHVRRVASCSEYRAAFDEETARADYTVVIAPECGGTLAACVERALECGGKLLSPSPTVVRLASDKHATAEHLASHGVAVPQGRLLAPRESLPADLAYPLVLKPCDGAGSQGIRLIESPLDAHELALPAGNWRVETFCSGMPASAAALCGPAGCTALPPCAQKLSADGQFRYLGGWLPLDPPLAARARALATRALHTLPSPSGYLGVDLILGACASGRDDVVIEINPRLTTSYVGLHASVHGNLAQAMLDVAAGRMPSLPVGKRRVEFDADGTLRFVGHE